MSDIKLISEEYTSRFVTGPELQTELSKKQDYVGLSFDDDQNVVQIIFRGFSQIGGNESNYFDGPTKFFSPIYIQGPIVDETNSITLVQCKETYDGSGVHQVVIGDGSHSVYINGPLYDEDGNKITGGGGGGSKYVYDDTANNNLVLGRGTDGSTPDSIFVEGPIYMSYPTGDNGYGSISANRYPMGLCVEIKAQADNPYSSKSASIEVAAEAGAGIALKINDRECLLLEDDLRKLREILDAHS